LRGLLNSGKIGADALIGVETWMPLVTLSGLDSVGASGKAGESSGKKGEGQGRPGKGARPAGDEPDDEELMEGEPEEPQEEIEEYEDEEQESEPKSDDDSDSLKVGDEFQID